eukprot:13521135-Alexandrium_andersonii.AAC.1
MARMPARALPRMWTSGSGGTWRSPCQRMRGEWPRRPATGSGRRIEGARPGNGSTWRAPPNP